MRSRGKILLQSKFENKYFGGFSVPMAYIRAVEVLVMIV